ncbi:hypothetical protein [uncultured Zoogloea sp.]|uniref:hypothetical protein n=1 Tax=uncultured Zoogloea sp. TaxID=160237 RepID=UPI0026092064|nr:hypothetical protein [uncultured Zoogloea sp.]
MMSLFLEVILLVVLPALYASGVSWALWPGFSRPWLFAFSSVALLYFLYFIVFYFGAPSGVGFVLEVPYHGEPSRQAFLVFLEPYVKPMLLFSMLSVPLLGLLIKVFRKKAA